MIISKTLCNTSFFGRYVNFKDNSTEYGRSTRRSMSDPCGYIFTCSQSRAYPYDNHKISEKSERVSRVGKVEHPATREIKEKSNNLCSIMFSLESFDSRIIILEKEQHLGV